MNRIPCIAAACLLTLCAHASDKPLYRYLDDQGVVHYSDKAPNKFIKPLALNRLGRPDKSNAPMGSAALPSTPRFAVHFDTPTPEQVYYTDEKSIPVSLSVMPGLIKGFGLILKVDGINVGKTPVRDIHTTLHDLGAGSHVIVAVLQNARGQELARSSPLKILIRTRTAEQ